MKEISIDDFFKKTNYTYSNIEDKLLKINEITKTRVDPSKTNIKQHFGIEQSFLLYYIAEVVGAKKIIEIGTGRGTGSYSFSLLKNVELVNTFDIVPFTENMNTAVNFKKFIGSNKDLYNLIPYDEKSKIDFKHINELNVEYKINNKDNFDLAFIDGNHDDYETIMNDFLNCSLLTNDNGIIVFDDYGNFPVVTKVINDIIEKHPEYIFVNIPFRGHLFMKDKACNDSSEVILFKNQKTADLFNV